MLHASDHAWPLAALVSSFLTWLTTGGRAKALYNWGLRFCAAGLRLCKAVLQGGFNAFVRGNFPPLFTPFMIVWPAQVRAEIFEPYLNEAMIEYYRLRRLRRNRPNLFVLNFAFAIKMAWLFAYSIFASCKLAATAMKAWVIGLFHRQNKPFQSTPQPEVNTPPKRHATPQTAKRKTKRRKR